MGGSPIRVLLVDDNRDVRVALVRVLRRAEDISVVGESATVADAISAADETRPDVVVLDLRLPDGSGARAARHIRSRRSEVRVLLLTSAAEDEALAAGVMAGATAVVRKQLRGLDLASKVRDVAYGAVSLDSNERARACAVLEARLRSARPPVLALVAEGRSDREIASHLDEDEDAVSREVGAMADAIAHRQSWPFDAERIDGPFAGRSPD